MNRAILTLIALQVACLVASAAAAQAGANDPEIVFDPPLTVTIRQTNGAPARGDVLSMNEQDLLLRTVGGKDVRIKLERIRSIKTANESFEFWPADESFTDLCGRVDAVPGATLMGDVAKPAPARGARRSTQNRTAPVDEDDPEVRRERRQAARDASPKIGSGDILAKGRPGLEKLQAAKRGDDPEQQAATRPGRDRQNDERGADESPADEAPNQDETPASGTTIYSCSHCQEDLPLSFNSGDACPHCGKLVVHEHESAETAAEDTVVTRDDPFKSNVPATTPAPVPVAAPAAVAPVAGGGMGLADMPLIAKVGIFAGFLIVGWLVLQRR